MDLTTKKYPLKIYLSRGLRIRFQVAACKNVIYQSMIRPFGQTVFSTESANSGRSTKDAFSPEESFQTQRAALLNSLKGTIARRMYIK